MTTMHNPTKPAAAVRPTPNSIVFNDGGRTFEAFFNPRTGRFAVQYLPGRPHERDQRETQEDRRNAAELSQVVRHATDLREAAEALGLLK